MTDQKRSASPDLVGMITGAIIAIVLVGGHLTNVADEWKKDSITKIDQQLANR